MAPPPDTPPTLPRIDDPDLRSDVRLLAYKFDQLDKKFDGLTGKLENSYASKAELADVREDVNGIRAQLSWVVKLIIGAVIAAALGFVLQKGGVPRL